MEFDVFLYGRTKTYDYFDMYMPSWLTVDSAEYSDYRKIISHIFKIRDILSESQSEILQNTANSFYFYKTSNICMLCRCCHVVGKDEYGRTICSTEGFICKNQDEKDFWFSIPDMIVILLSGQKTFYDQYMDKYCDSSKPPQISRSRKINYTIDIMSEINYSEDINSLISSYNIENQFRSLVSAMRTCVIPFNFVIGQHDKKIYIYENSKNVPDIQMYFAADECTKIPDDLSWKHTYKPLILNNTVSNYYVYLDIKKSLQGKVRYRLVTGNKPDSENIITDVPCVGYETESDEEINISDLIVMYNTMKEYLFNSGWCQSTESNYMFEKW